MQWQGLPRQAARGRSTFGGQSLSIPLKVARGTRISLGTQANIFARIGRIFRSFVNSAVSASEDPEKLLTQAVEDMQNDLIKLRQATAQVKGSLIQIENKYKQAQTTADDWYRRAELALARGEEALAREALVRRKAFQVMAFPRA